MMLCAKFSWNCLSGSEEDFWMSLMDFCYIAIISPRKGHWINQNSLSQRTLCTKLGWIWLSGSGNVITVFTISYFPSLGEEHGPSFENLKFPFTQDALCQVWLKMAKWFWSFKKMKMCKVYTDRWTDRRGTTGDQKSLPWNRWAKKA